MYKHGSACLSIRRGCSHSHRLFSYGLHRYGLYSYGLCSYGLYSYGLWSYGACRFAEGAATVAATDERIAAAYLLQTPVLATSLSQTKKNSYGLSGYDLHGHGACSYGIDTVTAHQLKRCDFKTNKKQKN